MTRDTACLPTVDELPSFGDVLESTPYRLTMFLDTFTLRLGIECSHTATVKLLHAYLTKSLHDSWDVKWGQTALSSYGNLLVSGRRTVYAADLANMAMGVRHIIERLGFERIHASDTAWVTDNARYRATTWEFSRSEEFTE